MITICFTYFRSLTLENLSAALYSVRQQDLSRVESVVVLDNNTADGIYEIEAIIDELAFPVPVRHLSHKHKDSTKTHSWSTNVAVRRADTPWVFFTRADFLLDFDIIRRFMKVIEGRRANWNGFITSNGFHMAVDIAAVANTAWRANGPHMLRGSPGNEIDYTCIDTGVWMARRADFDEVGGLDEDLTCWGHAQTHFQWKLHKAGVECVRIPEVMYYHPQHGAERDIGLAHQQLREQGINLKELWERYEGVKFY